MKAPQTPSEEAVAAIKDALTQADASRQDTVRLAAGVLAAKLRALQGAAKKEQARAPLSAATQARIAHFEKLGQAVEALRLQDAHRPAVTVETFVIHGRVTDAKGRPLANYLLSVDDPQQSLKGRIPPVPSDAQGFFTLTLRAAEFPDLVKNKTDLFIRVTDQKGREVYAPPETVHLEPGTTAVFSAISRISKS